MSTISTDVKQRFSNENGVVTDEHVSNAVTAYLSDQMEKDTLNEVVKHNMTNTPFNIEPAVPDVDISIIATPEVAYYQDYFAGIVGVTNNEDEEVTVDVVVDGTVENTVSVSGGENVMTGWEVEPPEHGEKKTYTVTVADETEDVTAYREDIESQQLVISDYEPSNIELAVDEDTTLYVTVQNTYDQAKKVWVFCNWTAEEAIIPGNGKAVVKIEGLGREFGTNVAPGEEGHFPIRLQPPETAMAEDVIDDGVVTIKRSDE